MYTGNKLTIKMLGEFSISYDGQPVISKESRNSKSLQLLQYLLMNRNRPISQEELIQVLLEGEESDNPANVLKNIVYRLRKLLSSSGLPEYEYIPFEKGSYRFSGEVPCEIDTEQFMQYAYQDSPEACLKAAQAYSGDLLPKLSGEMWVMTETIRLQQAYIHCIKKAYYQQEETGLDIFMPLLSKAASLYPYEEEIQAMRIDCLAKLNRYEEAVREYEAVVSMLFNDLGVYPGEALLNTYNQLAGRVNNLNVSITQVRQDISEKEKGAGAFFSNIPSFTCTYQFVVRNFERTGQSVFLLLTTLQDAEGAPLHQGEMLTKAADAFHEAIKRSLRRGDLYTRYSPSQFLILLMSINQENCEMVSGRIERNFYQLCNRKNATIRCQIVFGVDMDQVMENATGSKNNYSW